MSSNGGFADLFSLGTASTTNTTRRSTSTVRSRNRRLISLTDDDVDENGRQMQSSGLSSMLSPDTSAVRSRGATPSPNPSRGVSPIPMRHPSRATEAASRSKGNGSLDFLDVSWTSLQSLASSVLGSDIARPATNGTAKTHARKPSRPDAYPRPPTRTSAPSTWGPPVPSTPEIGSGTQEERQALVQAKKREALLLADTGPAWSTTARHKRRDSSDRTGHSTVDPDHDEDALAYIHHVQATDTITGVTIRYGCQPAVFRKANGFWPSDSIQGRKTVLLPVDSCSVKGRPIRPRIEEEDLLGEGRQERESLEDLSGSSIAPTSSSGFVEGVTPAAPAAEFEGDRTWKHESWVHIEGFPAPVEIGRVPRRTLGFFPRTRRKSIAYTDSVSSPVSGRGATSVSSSPSPVESASAQPAIPPWSRPHADSSASRTSLKPKPGVRHQRQRSGIQLSGPGVGTLDHDSTAPGPAMDGLSKFFAQHLPNLAPVALPPDFESSSESTSTAAANTPTGLDHLGGAVESWVRKMTTRAKASLNELQQPQSSPRDDPAQAIGRRGNGDLIELNDGLESRSSSNAISEPRWRPDLLRSGSSLQDGTALRGRFLSPSPGTSRTRSGGDRAKDD
ncbi:hypothetical protein BO78DRAFT_413130 [Aspergillus sclerotiicarbonarius CBS 121057]|uniref:LysM domain protein n=1 Tax=Aspergillus sclerotiicarbonarius (strain CBS 121057 / IBT 28362) TaxID=1448318 RepID=A0A319EQZ0_ASPSB|nr:hypothetical protein BO78DRAFT_413130 [Aspergillus sclerotiicarbonarius CBS 121057]